MHCQICNQTKNERGKGSNYLKRENNTNQSIQRNDSKREDGQLTGERRNKTREATQVRVSPHPVVQDVDTPIIRVHDSNDQEVHTHEEISDSKIGD